MDNFGSEEVRRDIIILIDSREHYGSQAQAVFSRHDINSEIVTLPHTSGADYLIANTHGSCAIQRKASIEEICGTPVSDRFKSAMEELRYEILPNLIEFSRNPVLLVEETHNIGEMGYLFRRDGNVWRETSMHCSSYYGFLETVRSMGVDVVCTRNFDQSIWYMISLEGYLGKCHYPRHLKSFGLDQQATGMLCCVPGVGEARATKALKGYSIADLLHASQVDGLTAKQLLKVKNVLRFKL
jgi:hypothetical protein